MGEEVALLIIGALIGFMSSILTLIVTNILDEKGKVKIYTKIVYDKTGSGNTWGFFMGNTGLYFQIPLWIEIHNTSKVTKVVRDFNFLLFYKGKEICSMTQINKVNDELYGNEGAYSFVIDSCSIQKYDCHFTIKKSDMTETNEFDEIRVVYFDSKDKKQIIPFKNISESWELSKKEKDKVWNLISK